MTSDHDGAREHLQAHATMAEATLAHQDGAFDWAAHLARLERGEELFEPLFEQAAGWLRELRDSAPVGRILDVGSGAGVVSAVLARAFPDAQVMAVDGTPALLDAVGVRAERLGISKQVHVLHASLPEDAASLPEADLIWASDALHHLGDQQAAIDLLHRRLSPGGLLAVCEGGLPARYLPNELGFGRPGLQARLDAASADRFAAMRAALPGAVAAIDDWPGMLRASGLQGVSSRSFLRDIPSPLPDKARAFVIGEFAAFHDWLNEQLDTTDVSSLARLLDQDDAQGLMRRPDVFVLAARTVHTARRRERTA